MPKREVLSKFIAISGYSGAIDLSAASRLFGQSVLPLFKEEIEFLGKMGCIMVDGDVIRITRKGFQYYGAVFSMFFLQIGDDRGL